VKTLALLLSLATATASLVAQQFPIADPLLRPATNLQTSPTVAASGSDFLTAWEDDRSVDPNGFRQPDVYASRLWPSGNLDQAGGVAVSPTSWDDRSPTAIWNGHEYVVISRVLQRAPRIGAMFSRVTDEGPEPGTLVPAPSGNTLTAAWNGSVYLLVAGAKEPMRVDIPDSTHGVIRAWLVDGSFRPIGASFDISDAVKDSFLPSVTSDGSSFFVTWLTFQASVGTELHSAVVSASGEVNRSGTPIASFSQTYGAWAAASAAWNGDKYLMAWADSHAVLCRFVDRSGTPLGDPIIVQPPRVEGVGRVSASWNGAMFLVAFDRREPPAPGQYPIPRLCAVRLRSDGTVMDTQDSIHVSNAGGEQTQSVVAATAGRFVIVWQNGTDIRAAVLDPEARAIVSDELVSRSTGRQSDGFGVFDGQSFGFLWTEESDVMFGRMAIGGSILDGSGQKLGDGIARALLSNGDEYLAVWFDKGACFATRVSSSGERLDEAPLQIGSEASGFATDGTDFLIITIPRTALPDGWLVPHVATQIVTSTGTVTAAAPLVAAEFDQSFTAVVWDGTHYLVFYRQYLFENCYHCGHQNDFEELMVVVDRFGHAVGSPIGIVSSGLAPPGMVAQGNGRCLIAANVWWASDNRSHLTYTIADESGVVVPPVVLRVDPPPISSVAWDGRAFLIFAGTTMYRIAASGELLDEDDLQLPPGTLESRVIPARGSAPLLIRRIEKQQPDSHPGGIERYFLFWSHPPRARAVLRR
jgi:hypothetical protein